MTIMLLSQSPPAEHSGFCFEILNISAATTQIFTDSIHSTSCNIINSSKSGQLQHRSNKKHGDFCKQGIHSNQAPPATHCTLETNGSIYSSYASLKGSCLLKVNNYIYCFIFLFECFYFILM